MNWGIKVLQTSALPLGYGAVCAGERTPSIKKTLNIQLNIQRQNGADDEARTRYLHLGKVALYQMSYIRIFCFFVFVCSLTTMFIIRENPPFVNNILKVFLKNFFEPENGAAPHSEAAPCLFVGIQNL